MKIRSGFSFRHSVGHLPDIVSRLQEIGWTAAPISDRASTFGFTKFTKLAKKAGLRPIYGVELGVVTRIGEAKPVIDFWSFFATKSLRSLHDLIGIATSSPDREPTLSYAQALAAKDLIIIAGERLQLTSLPKGQLKNFYVGLSPALPKGLFNEAQQRGLKFIATGDNVYPRKEDLEFYRVTLGKRAGTQTYPQWIISDDEWREACQFIAPKAALDQAIKNRNAAMKLCVAEMKKATLLKPEKPKTLRQMCIEGARRTGTNLKDPVYRERLDRELALIAEKQFEDYFYVIADMVNWAKEKMIVGPARGSSCGSLVCYLLNITTIDPIPYGLIFERFIDTTRTDLPDIDIDFSDQRRQMVFDYAEQKYGADHVARLGTVGMFKPRSALNQAGIALQIPKWQVEKVLDGVIERSGGDSRALQALEDTLNDTEAGRKMLAEYPEVKIAGRMEGHPNNASQHAAGIVITEEPVAEYVAVDRRTKSAMVDKKDAEELNLLKIDALGLTQLSIFERTLQLIGKPDISGYLETLLLDDPLAFEVLNKGHFAGIFQFTGGALQSLVKQIKITSLNDFISITALARPGPMATGGANSWVKRKLGKEKVTEIHPMLSDLTKETFGIVVYQETVMNVGRLIGQLSWEDVSSLRKAMAKSLGDEFFGQFWEKFKVGAIKNGIDPDTAKIIWDQICEFGSMGFNKCLDGDTKVKLAYANQIHGKGGVKIKDLYRLYETSKGPWTKANQTKPWLVSLFDDGRGRPQHAVKIIKSGKKVCWRYKFSDGASVCCTPYHKFLINGKWQPISAAKIGDAFTFLASAPQPSMNNGRGTGHAKGRKWNIGEDGARTGESNVSWTTGVSKYKADFRKVMKGCCCEDCGERTFRMEAHHNDFKEGQIRPNDLAWLCASCHKKRHYKKGRVSHWQKGMEQKTKVLINKKKVGLRETYDIEMPEHHNFTLANGLVTHNSHAVAYGIVSYWACWLKAHHPLEFAAATLDAESEPLKQIQLLRELSQEGIEYTPVDPEHSTDRWVPVKEGNRQRLVGPLTSIKGIGPSAVMEILDARKQGKPIRETLKKRLLSASTEIDSLYPVRDAVKRLHPDLSKINIVSTPTPVRQVQCGIEGEVMIIAVVKKIAPKDENQQVDIMKREAQGRRGRLSGPTQALNLFFQDDSDEIFCKVNRYKFEQLGRQIIEKGKPGKSIWAIKGMCPPSFRMLDIQAVKYLGDMDD